MAAYRLNTLWWSIGLVAGGLVLLLFNFGQLTTYERWTQYTLAVVLAILGGAFGVSFFAARQQWWRLIPGWTLLALAAMLYWDAYAKSSGQQTAAFLFVGLAGAFLSIYLLDHTERWWALIPGGFMFVLAGLIGVSSTMPHLEVLLIGMGLVFFLLYLLEHQQWWALIPGGVLTLYGFFIFAALYREQYAVVRWWPLLLIFCGLALGWQATRRPPAQQISVNHAPRLASRQRSPTPANGTNRRQGRLGDYTHPAPGASVEILPDPDEE